MNKDQANGLEVVDQIYEYVAGRSIYGSLHMLDKVLEVRAILSNAQAYAEQVRAETIEAALACYSPDDSATDWADKIRALGEKK